jgi:hypothetical protein
LKKVNSECDWIDGIVLSGNSSSRSTSQSPNTNSRN